MRKRWGWGGGGVVGVIDGPLSLSTESALRMLPHILGDC